MQLTFLGGAGTVTGSKYLIECGETKVLVDCGLFQGLKELRQQNWRPFPVEPSSIDAVVLTHAHLDHIGYLPRLVKEGFSGPVYCTEATRDLCRILLPDSGHLQEEDARYANRRGYTRHRPALPLFTRDEAVSSLNRLHGVPFDCEVSLTETSSFRFRRAGHILGAASVSMHSRGRNIFFSGDVGRPRDPLMKPPRTPDAMDYLVIESTYGDRVHRRENHALVLTNIVRRISQRSAMLLVPAFAVGRAQALLHLLAELRASGEIPDIPVLLNSPMAVDATEIFCEHPQDHRLSELQCRRMCQGVEFVNDVEASKALNERAGPMIIVSASGMATGGRILHHLKAFAPDPKNAILFVGFQAAGTRGEAMVRGARSIRIHGETVPVRAEVIHVDGLSAHADAGELVAWLRGVERRPRQVFVTHGEPASARAFRDRLQWELGWFPEIPRSGHTVQI